MTDYIPPEVALYIYVCMIIYLIQWHYNADGGVNIVYDGVAGTQSKNLKFLLRKKRDLSSDNNNGLELISPGTYDLI